MFHFMFLSYFTFSSIGLIHQIGLARFAFDHLDRFPLDSQFSAHQLPNSLLSCHGLLPGNSGLHGAWIVEP